MDRMLSCEAFCNLWGVRRKTYGRRAQGWNKALGAPWKASWALSTFQLFSRNLKKKFNSLWRYFNFSQEFALGFALHARFNRTSEKDMISAAFPGIIPKLLTLKEENSTRIRWRSNAAAFHWGKGDRNVCQHLNLFCWPPHRVHYSWVDKYCHSPSQKLPGLLPFHCRGEGRSALGCYTTLQEVPKNSYCFSFGEGWCMFWKTSMSNFSVLTLSFYLAEGGI